LITFDGIGFRPDTVLSITRQILEVEKHFDANKLS